ncbi:MAG: hypothetical protein AB8E87_03280 [Prochlorococcus sp.]
MKSCQSAETGPSVTWGRAREPLQMASVFLGKHGANARLAASAAEPAAEQG